MNPGAIAALALPVALSAPAATLESHAFEFAAGRSTYHFEALVQAPAAEVSETLVNPGRIARTNDGIRESRVVSRDADGSFVREIRMEQCVIGICFDIRFVEEVREAGDGILEVRQLPNVGTFRRGNARWTVTSLGNGETRLTMQADQEPSFWVPPIIGPYLMRRAFEHEVRETVRKIEEISSAASLR